jgi:hypothetical protein
MLQEMLPRPLQAEEILRLAASERVLDFAVGTLDFSSPLTEVLLCEMSALRQEEYLGLALSCDLAGPVTAKQSALMQRAGVTTARLKSFAKTPAYGLRAPAILKELESVKLLHEADIRTEWQFDLSDNTISPEIAVSIMAASHHLPPPGAIMHPTSGKVEEAEAELERWRSLFRMCSLSYARGPGFTRIRDRRDVENHWTFVTLTAIQASVFDFCRTARSVEEIREFAPDIPVPRMGRFLESMAQRRLMCSVNAFHLALPVRRKVEERWSSDVY